MKATFHCVLLATAGILLSSTSTQAAQGPASFDGNQVPLEVVDAISVSGPDYERLRAEDLVKDNEIGPRRVCRVGRSQPLQPTMGHGNT